VVVLVVVLVVAVIMIRAADDSYQIQVSGLLIFA
jgi:cell division protein FtsL